MINEFLELIYMSHDKMGCVYRCYAKFNPQTAIAVTAYTTKLLQSHDIPITYIIINKERSRSKL